MDASAHAPGPLHAVKTPSAPAALKLTLIGAAALCGAGIFLIAYFLTFLYLPALSGVLLVIVGALLLFNPRTGPEHA